MESHAAAALPMQTSRMVAKVNHKVSARAVNPDKRRSESDEKGCLSERPVGWLKHFYSGPRIRRWDLM